MNANLRLRIIELYGSQADYSQEIGVSESLVSRVIRGRRKLDAVEQRRWAKALKCKPYQIFGEHAVNS